MRSSGLSWQHGSDGASSLILRTAFLVVLVALVYANSLRNPFHFDDWHVIVQNPAVHSLRNTPSFFVDPSNFSLVPANRDYRPVFLTSMALCWGLGDGSTRPFHLLSIALHGLNVLLVFAIMRLLLAAHGAALGVVDSGERRWTAFVAAALFAVHPLASEPVNYISSQSELLVAFFGLLSFLLFLSAHEDHSGRSPGRLRQLGSVVAYFAALLSKPNAIVLWPVMLLWELLLGTGPTGYSRGPSWRIRLQRLWKHVPYAVATILYLLIRKVLMPSGGSITSLDSRSDWYLTQTKALVFHYLRLAMLPVGQNVDVEYPISKSFFDIEVMGATLILALFVLLLFHLRRRKLIIFWALWFPACMVVTSYVVVLRQVVTEHRVYLSLVGFTALAALALASLHRVLARQLARLRLVTRFEDGLVGAMMVLLLAAYGFATWQRNQVWSSDLALWEEAASRGGGWRAHMNYGIALEQAGRFDEALEELRKALEFGQRPYPHINLGSVYIRHGQFEEGLAHLRTAVKNWPSLPDTHFHLAYGLIRAGQDAEAEQELLKAIELRPNYIKALRSLVGLQKRQGRFEEARSSYKRLIKADPTVVSRSDKKDDAVTPPVFPEGVEGASEGGPRPGG